MLSKIMDIRIPTGHAIIAGCALIALAIVLARLIVPYEISANGGSAWRLNAITGNVEICTPKLIAGGRYQISCAGGL